MSPSATWLNLTSSSVAAAQKPPSPTLGSASNNVLSSSSSAPRISSPLSGKPASGSRTPQSAPWSNNNLGVKGASPSLSPSLSPEPGFAATKGSESASSSIVGVDDQDVLSDSPQSASNSLPAATLVADQFTEPIPPRHRPRGHSTSTLRGSRNLRAEEPRESSLPSSALSQAAPSSASASMLPPQISSPASASSFNVWRGRSVAVAPVMEAARSKPQTHSYHAHGHTKSRSRSRSRDSSILDLPGVGTIDLRTGEGLAAFSSAKAPASHQRDQTTAELELLATERQEASAVANLASQERMHKQQSLPGAPAGFRSGQGFGAGSPGGSAIVIAAKSPKGKPVTEAKRTGTTETTVTTSTRRTSVSAPDPELEQLDGWFVARGHVARAVRAALGPGSSVRHVILEDLALITGEDSQRHTSQIRVPARLPANARTSGRDILDMAANAAHEILELGTEFLDFAPIPGLQATARTLLAVWDALEGVDLNRLACIGLVKRCADTLYSVREEIHQAGDEVTVELRKPIDQLTSTFQDILQLLLKIADMSFLKRYLKRDDIARQISGSHDAITSAVAMFNLQVQIRCLKYAQATFTNTRQLLEQMGHTSSPTTTLAPGPPFPATSSQAPPTKASNVPKPSNPGIPTITKPEDVVDQLREVHGRRNWDDRRVDEEGRRRILAEAMRPGNDMLIVQKLQLDPTQWPEAIKALQRELEREIEKDGMASSIMPGHPVPASQQANVATGGGLVLGSETRMPIAEPSIPPPLTLDPSGDVFLEDVVDGSVTTATASLTRTGTVSTVDTTDSGYSSTARDKDTLDREFLESVIDALRRMSKGSEKVLPSWTITNFEIDREKQVGSGFFATVYKGSWRRRVVAIKELAPTAPRNLFIHEVEIWQALHHPNVLELFGASSTTADPPWFFVSPYMQYGDLAHFLSHVKSEMNASPGSSHGNSTIPGNSPSAAGSRSGSRSPGRGRPGGGAGIGGWRMLSTPPEHTPTELPDTRRLQKSTDLLRFMHEIAKGMEYLHSKGVLHGDLKGVNVLVNDRIHCVITDFGQSELKSEAYRLSGMSIPHGTFRWQAPELLKGSIDLTTEMDVYSFAITCVEILNWGRVPFSLMDDDSYRHLVLKENGRPPVPPSRYVTPPLLDLLNICWHVDPFERPSFSKIVPSLGLIRHTPGIEIDEVASPQPSEQLEIENVVHRVSPDMHPIPLPWDHVRNVLGLSPSSSDAASYRTARDQSHSPQPPDLPHAARSESVFEHIPMPEPVIYNPASPPRSRASSLFTSSPSTKSDEVAPNLPEYDGYDSPPPLDERLADIRNERRYRMLLNHEFHPSLTLPLWSPSPIPVGSVGYLHKPKGSFVTLFNAFNPLKSGGVDLPSLHGYGLVSVGKQRQDKRSAAQRGLDLFAGLLKGSHNTSRKYSFPLRAGHKSAYLCTESTLYHYLESLDTPKKWFKASADAIITQFGDLHEIQKEDVYLIIGTLSAPDYALFVSHSHPDGQAHFHIHSSQRVGQPWGTFTTDTEVSPDVAGPSYHEDIGDVQFASKVSTSGGPWDTVLVAKLRFKPDSSEPTSL